MLMRFITLLLEHVRADKDGSVMLQNVTDVIRAVWAVEVLLAETVQVVLLISNLIQMVSAL